MLNILAETLPPPSEIKRKLPINLAIANKLLKIKSEVKSIFDRSSIKLVIVAGPCSVHDRASFLHYAELFKSLSEKVKKNIFLVLRFFSEKSRTSLGWKGYIYDPELNNSCNIEKGIIETRKILLQLTSIGIPCAMEFVDPLVVPYLDDLISWGFIGARTSSSQPHRLLASSITNPVGFKNATDGCIEVAINGMLTSREAHNFIGLNQCGQVSKISSHGNPYTHLVLRGSETRTNFELKDISRAEKEIKKLKIKPKILVDCSHGNSAKDIETQKKVFISVLESFQKKPSTILGMMLESFIFKGSQDFKTFPSYGVSITDPCLNWKSTEELILLANKKIDGKFSCIVH